jgi:hypothetical protein
LIAKILSVTVLVLGVIGSTLGLLDRGASLLLVPGAILIAAGVISMAIIEGRKSS